MAKGSEQRKPAAHGAFDATAPAHLALADALALRGRTQDAIRLYEDALRSDPASAPALRGLARAQLAAGEPAQAFARADAALALDFHDAEAWGLVGDALDALGESAIAVQAYRQALALGSDTPSINLKAARICERLHEPHAAAARYLRTLDVKPDRREAIEAHVALSGLYGRAAQWPEARAHAEAALRLAPDARAAHQNLAILCEHEGRLADAQAHRDRAFTGAPLVVSRSARPRRRVLMLASATRANSPDAHLIPATDYDRLVWFLAYDDPAPWPEYDVVFNAIGDAEAAEALAPRIAAFAAHNTKPWLNRPDRIAATARDQAAQTFAGLDDLVVPPVRRVVTSAEAEGLDAEAQWLLRPVGTHGGERLERLSLAEASARLDGATPHFLTAYRDFASADGLYRKYRVFFVDRAAYPYHMAASRHWLVHYQTSLTPTRADLIAEERAYLEDPELNLGPRAWRAVAEAGRRLDLDYAGIDFAVLPDGRALLFEANATMLAHPEAPDGPLAHKNVHVQRIFAAFRALLERV